MYIFSFLNAFKRRICQQEHLLTHMAMSIGSKTVSASWQKAYKDIKLKKYADRYNMIGIEGPHLMK